MGLSQLPAKNEITRGRDLAGKKGLDSTNLHVEIDFLNFHAAEVEIAADATRGGSIEADDEDDEMRP